MYAKDHYFLKYSWIRKLDILVFIVEDVATTIVNVIIVPVHITLGCSLQHSVETEKSGAFFPSTKIRHYQQLMANDREKRLLTFLARVEVDASWPWKILWIDAHFHLSSQYP
ncbi:hypothetical protein TNCV_3174471 [Trichonephila clavipes]|nr:hypothetical protein TNCV_3174471 [Trichonephila clavipes]